MGDVNNADALPCAAPARADDLSGFLPAWIGVGTLDLFYEEDVAYAQRLTSVAVLIQLCVVDGAYHCFAVVDANAEVSQLFRKVQISALAAWLSGGD